MQLPTADVLSRLRANPYNKHRQCKECRLFEHCESPFMLGAGPKKAKVMFIGEAPGFDEDQQDEPFVGKSGAFLRQTLRAVGLDDTEIYFTNAVACRPPNNDIKYQSKAPVFCRGGVWQQIQDVDPDIVVLAGNVPLKSVLGIDKITHWSGTAIPTSKVKSLHLKDFPFEDGRERIYLPLLHPSYVLRTRHTEVEEVTIKKFGRDLLTLAGLAKGEIKASDTAPKLPPHRVIGWDALVAKERITNLACETAFAKVETTMESIWGTKAQAASQLEFENLRDLAFDEACAYLDDLHNYPRVGYDYETPDLDPYQTYSKILCVSFVPLKKKPGVKEYGAEYPWILPKEGVCIPVDHPDSPFTEKQRAVIKHKIREFLLNKNIRKFAWNHVFEYIAGTILLGV